MTETEKTRPRIGVGVVVIQEGKVLLGKRKGSHGAGQWSFAGGHLEFGETIEECAIRELREETGLNALSIRLGPWTNDLIEETIPGVIQESEFGKASAQNLGQMLVGPEAAPVQAQERCREIQRLGCEPCQNRFLDHERYKHYVTLWAIVDTFEGDPQLLEPHKCEGWQWFSWDELPSPLFRPIHSLLQVVSPDYFKK